MESTPKEMRRQVQASRPCDGGKACSAYLVGGAAPWVSVVRGKINCLLNPTNWQQNVLHASQGGVCDDRVALQCEPSSGPCSWSACLGGANSRKRRYLSLPPQPLRPATAARLIGASCQQSRPTRRQRRTAERPQSRSSLTRSSPTTFETPTQPYQPEIPSSNPLRTHGN